MRRNTLVVAGLLVSLLLVGCSDKNDPQPSGSAAEEKTVTPAWSVRTQAVKQPNVVDGVVVAAVVDTTSPTGESVVAWDSASGDELWRHDGTKPGVFKVGGTKRIAYGVFRSDVGSLVLADARTGEETVVAMPDGRRVDYVNACGQGGGVCVMSIVEAGYVYNNYRLDESAMVLNAVPYTGDNHVAEGVTMSYERSSGTSTAVIGLDGDADRAAWSRPLAEMLGTEGRWGGSYYYYGTTPWAWSGAGDVLLGSAQQYTDEGVAIDASQEFLSGGFAPDGTTLWTAPGYPCSGGWTTGAVQVLCVSTGTVSYTTTQTDTNMWTTLPDRTDDGSYWVGVDVRTGEQKWRFPEEGTQIVPDDVRQPFAPLKDGHFMVSTGDSRTLIDVATGKADVIEQDGVFLCVKSPRQDSTRTDGGESIFRSIRRICDYDGQPIVAPWPTRWVELTAEPDGQGNYILATASQVVAFKL
ncbi:MAG: hypothetical protein FWH11_03625 [Micrococcales bacterium]|nr:hypothetical protein [Micrococcales bacterium]